MISFSVNMRRIANHGSQFQCIEYILNDVLNYLYV